MAPTKFVLLAALVASASAFAPAPAFKSSTALKNQEKPDWEKAAEMGWSMGGQDYTRDLPSGSIKSDDARKSIPEPTSFEEYMKQRAAGGQ